MSCEVPTWRTSSRFLIGRKIFDQEKGQKMSEVPVQFIVAAFNDERVADGILKDLKQAKMEKLIGITNAAVLRKDQNGKLYIKETANMKSGKGAAGVSGSQFIATKDGFAVTSLEASEDEITLTGAAGSIEEKNLSEDSEREGK